MTTGHWLFDQEAARKTTTATTGPAAPYVGTVGAYAAKALDNEISNILGAANGTRNHTLNTAAYLLGTLVGAGQLPQQNVVDQLTTAALQAGLEPRETERTIRSGIDAGMEHPRQVDAPYTPPPVSVLGGIPAPERPRTRLLTRSELRAMPEPEPLIENTLDRRTVAMLGGYWGTLKSFIALDWALSIATGHSWQGRPTITGPVIYIAAEGAYGIGKRVDAWEYAWNKNQQTPDDMFQVYPAPLNLLRPQEVTELCAMSDGMTLVVVDTVNRCAVGGDENSARDMGMFVDALYRIREATGDGTVLPLHHTGKDKTTIRGSSALEAGVDTIYQTEGDHTGITLKRTKRKDGPADDVHQMRLAAMLMSGIVENNAVGLAPSGNTLLSHFHSHFSNTGATANQLRESIPDMSKTTYYRSLNKLINDGLLRNEGTDQRPYYRLTEET